jgi:hypothetical protein
MKQKKLVALFPGSYAIIKETDRSHMAAVSFRDFFNYETSLTKEELKQFPNITNIDLNPKRQRKRKKNKAKKDNIVCYPFCHTEFGQIGGVTKLDKPKVVKSHILGKEITALYEASSISHRVEYIYDFLHGNYRTPILQGTIQKVNLKELKDFYRDPDTGEAYDFTNKTSEEIFEMSEKGKTDYLEYKMVLLVSESGLHPETISRNNMWLNMGESFEVWEEFRCANIPVVDYISDFSFQTNNKDIDRGVHPIYSLENNPKEIEKDDKGLVLKNQPDKNANFFEHGCYLYFKAMSAVKNKPIDRWPTQNPTQVRDRLSALTEPTKSITSWIKRMNDFGLDFFNEIGDGKNDLSKDFISFDYLIYIIYDIEQKFGGKFKMNDWSKFAKRINEIFQTLSNSSDLLLEKTWMPSAGDKQTYPVFKFRTKNNLLNFGLRLVLDRLYDTKKEDLGLSALGVVVEPRKVLSAEDKRKIRTRQTKGEEIICDISGKAYPIDELEYCHIDAKSFGLLNSTEVNEPENIRLAHWKYNRMMGTMNYNAFKKHYKSNSKTIDTQLMLDK